MTTNDIERHNHQQIEQLNQRGGRTLSIVDLIQAGTISVEMAAFHESDGQGGHRLLFRWEPKTDRFETVGELGRPDELKPYLNFVRQLVEQGEAKIEAVRRRVVAFYHGTK